MLGLLILIAYLTGLAIFLEALFREKSVEMPLGSRAKS